MTDRAYSLTVLAQEELGKALWIRDAFQLYWSSGADQPRAVNALAQHGRSHAEKYLEAVIFGGDLAEFWGDCTAVRATGSNCEEWEQAHKARQQEAEAAARTVNLAKQSTSTATRTTPFYPSHVFPPEPPEQTCRPPHAWLRCS
ncbi:AbiV family abortive infection protein [Streptomyces anulatus]|uniref:AbiV family abortive infection protein n=1 Tax=Streptomyces anulatus TaxID=1892 RepID=UPI003656C9E6